MTRLYGLIGRTLGHSFSAEFFNSRFRASGEDACYRLFPLADIGELPRLIRDNPELCGLNVTIPYKESVLPLLDGLSEEAERIGAVNVIRMERNGKDVRLTGHNTDAAGFRLSLERLLGGARPEGALVLGSGGASKAVRYVLESLGITPLTVSRTPRNGTAGYDDLDREVLLRHRLIVNTTPLGMWPDVDSEPPIPWEYVDEGFYCHDLVYNPGTTRFMRSAAGRGARAANGLLMLHAQAVEAYRLWNRGRQLPAAWETI